MLAWPADWERLYSVALNSCGEQTQMFYSSFSLDDSCWIYSQAAHGHVCGVLFSLLGTSHGLYSLLALPSVTRKENCTRKTVETPKDLKMSNSLISISDQRTAGFRHRCPHGTGEEKARTLRTSSLLSEPTVAPQLLTKGGTDLHWELASQAETDFDKVAFYYWNERFCHVQNSNFDYHDS